MGEREPLDQYFTPAKVWRAWLNRMGLDLLLPGCVVLDPCAGEGSLQFELDALGEGVHCIAGDIDPDAPIYGTMFECRASASIFDEGSWWHKPTGLVAENFLRAMKGERVPRRQLITNPPYATGAIDALFAIANAQKCTAISLLLRETKVRELLQDNPPDCICWLSRRIIWEGPGGDLLLRQKIARHRAAGKRDPSKPDSDMVNHVIATWFLNNRPASVTTRAIVAEVPE